MLRWNWIELNWKNCFFVATNNLHCDFLNLARKRAARCNRHKLRGLRCEFALILLFVNWRNKSQKSALNCVGDKRLPTKQTELKSSHEAAHSDLQFPRLIYCARFSRCESRLSLCAQLFVDIGSKRDALSLSSEVRANQQTTPKSAQKLPKQTNKQTTNNATQSNARRAQQIYIEKRFDAATQFSWVELRSVLFNSVQFNLHKFCCVCRFGSRLSRLSAYSRRLSSNCKAAPNKQTSSKRDKFLFLFVFSSYFGALALRVCRCLQLQARELRAPKLSSN